MEDILNKVYDYSTTYGLNLLYAIVIFIVGKWIARRISELFGKAMHAQNVDGALASFVKNLVYFSLLIFVIIAAIGKLGIQTTSFIAVLGAAGLAVGMALQGSLSNFAAGVMIILFKPFKLGDFVSVGGTKGVIKEIQIFNTILDTPNNIRIIVPNAQVTSGIIENYAANDKRRVDLIFGVGYEADIKKAKSILSDVVKSEEKVLKDEEITVAVSELGENSVNFVVRSWVKTADYWVAYFSLTEKVKLALDANGINIPYPQRDLHLKGDFLSLLKTGESVSA